MFNEHGNDGEYWSPNTVNNETALSYIPENVWNESCTVAQCGKANAGLWASGGGPSIFFSKPSWQAGVAGIPGDGARDVPDVSLTAANHDAYLLCVDKGCEPKNGRDNVSVDQRNVSLHSVVRGYYGARRSGNAFASGPSRCCALSSGESRKPEPVQRL